MAYIRCALQKCKRLYTGEADCYIRPRLENPELLRPESGNFKSYALNPARIRQAAA